MKLSALLPLLVLAGCSTSGNFRLLSEGKAYVGDYNTGAKSMAVDIDGTRCSGSYVFISGGGGTSTGVIGGKVAVLSGNPGTPSARSILVAADNRTLRCEFIPQARAVAGTCQDSAGRLFDMVQAAK